MIKHVVLSVGLSLAVVSPAFAEDLVPWGESGDWTILRDPNRGNGCLVQAAYEGGSYLRIGFEGKGEGKGYVASFNPAWQGLAEDQKYDVAIAFGDQSFVGEGRGIRVGDMPGVIALANDVNLLIALADADKVNLSIDGGPGLDIMLTGSYDALQQALVCQAE
jgi:hypothetical protein